MGFSVRRPLGEISRLLHEYFFGDYKVVARRQFNNKCKMVTLMYEVFPMAIYQCGRWKNKPGFENQKFYVEFEISAFTCNQCGLIRHMSKHCQVPDLHGSKKNIRM
eukprot:TRINITY_DN13044_c0_g1_i4.p1 TRINITY_DN13044_c0_g1~~TRINITY_DN13044_c0_g1_i4.p1  ORF type:complete len:106 (+),score=5.72 TRINITY_DN13044_c0_g1_i4:432-749(+)